jgi:hypothetical protein
MKGREYTKRIRTCDALHVELWDLYMGLKMTWHENISDLLSYIFKIWKERINPLVKSDSKILIDMISINYKLDENIKILVTTFVILFVWDGRFKSHELLLCLSLKRKFLHRQCKIIFCHMTPLSAYVTPLSWYDM